MADVKSLKVTEPHNRLLGGMPKIGIRPAIDGRRRGYHHMAQHPASERMMNAHQRAWTTNRKEVVICHEYLRR